MAKQYNRVKPTNVAEVKENAEVEEIKVAQVTKTPPKLKKKNIIERLVVGMIGPDGLQGITHHLTNEVILPAVKTLIFDSITSGVNMALWGEEGGRRGSGYARPVQRTAYNKQYTTQSVPTSSIVTPARRNQVEQYTFEFREEAKEVLMGMIEYANNYDNVSVADYYDMIGIKSEFTQNSFGWTYDQMLGVSIVPTQGAYMLNLPRVMELN